ncbi:PIN domain-like protein [Metschnikowia bicuspidata var. bicuspidata NRRL YB-4993]|uniref:PIN domain-like protein n=1 Tax=Metschnikowia bicuspidata var. bicuspidata NRRL YB-4993 TaxID=869754 RepID=A0A1A0H260_9ASCO|nr:PIN domain-like protein [Metschnikowia bicuspidata var. bicuspidata NRRL YB-4993]OBA18043.1 PIN domain-like protein [Metschnikowia bicuspidata var. bicuspidata NRRL YB-4993]
MGVTGLLQQLKQIQETTSLSKYKGKTLAVDTYGWLHRGLILCAQDLCTDAPTRGYITSVMKKVDMLLHFGVTPVMVFDGSPLPTKEGTHVERRLKREKARAQAQALVKRGDRKAAWKEYMKAAEVTPEMAKSVMVELDRRHVRYVVAPYEADPQMVYLEKTGAVDGILSEDLDLLVFGCTRLITKLNDYGGCVEICTGNLHKVPRMLLHTYTPAQWRLVAILSGCDYTKGVPGVGLKTAFSLVLRLGDLARIVAALRADNKPVPDDFMDEALRADLAFQYQKVFDPATQALTTLCAVAPDAGLDMHMLELCCGRRLAPHVHAGICAGKLHPSSHKPLVSREQNLLVARSHSVNAMPAAFRGSTTTTASNTSTSTAQVRKPLSSSRSIESFFQSSRPVLKAPASTAPRPAGALKRPGDPASQLSPSSKKLRRFQSVPSPGAGGSTQSKFFSSSQPMLPPVAVPRACPGDDADTGFLTGDSEVPESSSPIRTGAAAGLAGCDTDDDGDAADADDGYENEIDESPIKTERISLLWRQRFAMAAPGGEDACAFPSPKQTCVKAAAVKVQLTPTKNVRADRGSAPEVDDAQSLDDSPVSSPNPQTPEHVLEKRMLAEDSSQLKSLQPTCVSEIDEDLDVSPVRTALVLPKRKPALKLLRFAFTGR